MSATKKRSLAAGSQNRVGSGMGRGPDSVRGGLGTAERRARGGRNVSPRDFQAVVQAVWEEEEVLEGAQPIENYFWNVQPIEEEDEVEEEEVENDEEMDEEEVDDEEDEMDEEEDDYERDEESEEYEEEEEDSDEEEDAGYVDEEEEEDAPPEGRGPDTAADFKLEYFFRQLKIPKSVPGFPKEANEYQYENFDEEEERGDGNEKPEEGLKMDVGSAEGRPGKYSWKA
nr:mitotic apparatus protein p62-like [Camelus dromedarius]